MTLGLLGIEGTGVWVAYLLCIGSSLLCIIYGALHWNKGEEPPKAEDAKWAEHEKEAQEEVQ